MPIKLTAVAARRLQAAHGLVDSLTPKKRRKGEPAAVVSAAEDELAGQMEAVEIDFDRQYKFDSKRGWKLDFFVYTYDNDFFGVEVNGGIYKQERGAHSRPKGQERDYAKWSAAAIAGIRIIHVTPQDVADGTALKLITEAIG